MTARPWVNALYRIERPTVVVHSPLLSDPGTNAWVSCSASKELAEDGRPEFDWLYRFEETPPPLSGPENGREPDNPQEKE